jgi:GNAT superfamily N-acetyltransferase
VTEETYEIYEPSIKLKGNLNAEDHRLISALQEECTHDDPISLKLELDYKLGAALADNRSAGIQKINEFMYFDRQQLIGYIGICDFGGSRAPLEITGMVHPKYRRNGIFYKLHELAIAECKRRNSAVLLLCDKNSVSGQNLLKSIDAAYRYSEFEMYLKEEPFVLNEEQLCGIALRKAANADAAEIARQNSIYFDDPLQFDEADSGESDSDILLPKTKKNEVW